MAYVQLDGVPAIRPCYSSDNGDLVSGIATIALVFSCPSLLISLSRLLKCTLLLLSFIYLTCYNNIAICIL
ncbi:hypothetical protein V8C42DRAFT_319376 [Trichoderma barbatum]